MRLLGFLICCSVFILLAAGTACSSSVRIVNSGSEYSSIQQAIDSAAPGDAIDVESGNYYEEVNITKPLVLRGIDTGNGKPVVDALGANCAITLFVDGITLEGFRAVGARDAGIKVLSNNNTLMDNEASGNALGMDLYNSSRNFLRNNNLSGNDANFEVFLLDISPFENDIDVSNLVDGKPIYYVIGAEDMVFEPASNAGMIYCMDCSNVAVRGLNFSRSVVAVLIYNSTNSTIENNQFNGNKIAINLQNCQGGVIRNNNLTDNSRAGIFLAESSGSIVDSNNILHSGYGIILISSGNNSLQANNLSNNQVGIQLLYSSLNNEISSNYLFGNQEGLDLKDSSGNLIYSNGIVKSAVTDAYDSGLNRWDNGVVGNYYSRFSCADKDGDGIYDSEYSVPGGSGVDRHPLAYWRPEQGW